MDIEQSYPQPDGMVSIFSIACVPLTPVPTFAGMQCKGPWLVQYRVKYSGSSTVLVSAIRLFTREVPIHWVIVNCTIICNSAVHEQGTSIAGARVVIDARAGIRTRVGGMKTHYDGPGYTTRATAVPPTTP